MNRSRMLIATLSGATLLSFAPFALATTQTRADYNNALDRASVTYKDSRAKCEPLAGHDKDMCAVEAKAAEKKSKASAGGTRSASSRSRAAPSRSPFNSRYSERRRWYARVASDRTARVRSMI